jgi:nucleotide-binding universal stress UspA family protein
MSQQAIESCIVVGVHRDQDDCVLSAAAKLAKLFAVPLVCAHVDSGRYETAMEPDGSIQSESLDPDIVEDDATDFDPQRKSAVRSAVGSGVQLIFRDLAGEVAHALSAEAEQLGAAMIVVGARSGGIGVSVQEFFRGSVAVHLVHRQSRPVVVVPVSHAHPNHPPPWDQAPE